MTEFDEDGMPKGLRQAVLELEERTNELVRKYDLNGLSAMIATSFSFKKVVEAAYETAGEENQEMVRAVAYGIVVQIAEAVGANLEMVTKPDGPKEELN